jgi:hypothetical protein
MRLHHFFSIGLGLAMLTAASAASAASDGSDASYAAGAAESGPSANRYTEALNMLEAKGYPNFSNFHRSGGVFQAQVMSKGKTTTVTIDPDRGLIQTRL